MSYTAWISSDNAKKTADKSVEALAADLKEAARRSTEAAEVLMAGRQDLSKTPEFEEVIASLMMALSGKRILEEIDKSRGNYIPSAGTLRGEALALKSAIEEYQRMGRFPYSSYVDEDSSQAIRALLSHHWDDTVRVGDRVEWEAEPGRVEGTVLAIDDGICAVGQMIHWSGSGGSSDRGMRLQPVESVRKCIR